MTSKHVRTSIDELIYLFIAKKLRILLGCQKI